MKLIPLTQGKFAQVDDWNYNRLIEHKWCTSRYKNAYYATRHSSMVNGKRITIQMHREIMNTPDNLLCDHSDHNTLNNQEFNLRNCTRSQNNMNRRSGGESKYLGVSIHHKSNYTYIRAHIQINGIGIYLGQFKTEELAARVYDKAAKQYFGEFANLNFK